MLRHVKQRWITFYFALMGLMSTICLIIFVWHLISPNPITTYAEVTLPTAITAGLFIIFMVTVYPLFVKKSSYAVNVLGSSLLGIFLAASLATSNDVWHFRVLFVIICTLTPMAGMIAPIVISAVSWVMFIMVTMETLPGVIWREALVNILGTIGVMLGWLIFSRFYLKIDYSQSDAHERLEEEQSKSNALLEYISDGVIILDNKGVVQGLNQSAADILGWTKDEALHLDYRSLVLPSSQQNMPGKPVQPDAITETFSSKSPIQRVNLIETRNKRHTFIDIAASPIIRRELDPKKETSIELSGVIAVLRDVDKQKREEQQRSDFISTASHEMRTPVASIQGFIELALNPKVANIDEKARTYLDKAHEATKRLGKLFQDLLTVSRSEDGHLENKPQLIEVNEFIKEVIELEHLQAEKKNLQLIFDQKSIKDEKDSSEIKPLTYINVDPDRLREVIVNLLENAIKYTSKGFITIGVEVKERTIVIRVSDTGMGIAAEDIPHLFQKFYRTDSTATREVGGTGLGLYICKQIVEMMHGRIWAESEIGTGSTFFIEIPRVPPEVIQNHQTPSD